MKFNERLSELRKEKRLTQEELAKALKTTRSRIAMYEQGKREPDFEMQEAIADYFNVNLDYLMGRTEQRQIMLTMDYSELELSAVKQLPIRVLLYMYTFMQKEEQEKLMALIKTVFPNEYEKAEEFFRRLNKDEK